MKTEKEIKEWLIKDKEYNDLIWEEINIPMDEVIELLKEYSTQQLAERDKEIKEKDLLIKHWRNRFDHAESQLNDKTKSYSGILNWLEVTLSAESKLGASDEILNAYLTVKIYIQSL